ncbi:transglycosylase domain-containing protein [Bacillus pinisoli]|uniref:transglycosylase domain-containing protein n=1 Tax=Bacillus pinisoli TaxID=2901866 RepID=UPI001FF0F81A|nr:PBP1A family penicillin-binding protein [Bacillus pinisoli]
MAQNKSRAELKQAKKNSKKKNHSAGSLLKKVIIAFFILGIIGILAGGITFFALVKDAPPIDEALLTDAVSSKLLDKDGNKFAEIGIEKRTHVNYNEIPKLMENAILAVEDIRFYDHNGVDLRRLVGAVIANFQEGFGAEGASTLTQQVVKLSFLTPDKTIERKVQEQWLAIRLEQKYSKEQIFEMYANKIYLSSIPSYGQVYGVASAAEAYYGKKLQDLEIHEAAMIAGMPQSPNNYNPFEHPEAAQKRRNIVLTLMAKHGFITEAEAEEAKAIPVQSTLVQGQKDPQPYDAFIDQVLKELAELGDIDVSSAGLEIHTTLDPAAQTYVEQALNTNDIIEYPNEEFQAGIALINTQTGEIQAIGGGRNSNVSRGFNYATAIDRQPGSTIKPIIDYGPAIEYLQWSTYQQIVDEPYTYSDGSSIKNYDGKHKGQMSIRQALADSRNIPALKTFQEVGADRAGEFASTLGIRVGDVFESHSIGGFNGTSPLELAGAFSAFGNKGIYNKPHAVTKVVFMDGTETDLKPKSVTAMKESTAFMVTDMMRSVVTEGTGTSANISGLPVVGKTGTTNFPSDVKKKYDIKSGGVNDIWFAGYTPLYTAAVWTGYDTPEKGYILSSNEKAIAKQLFKAVVSKVSEGKETGDFVKPNSVVQVAVEKGTNPPKLPSEYTPDDQIVKEYFIKGTEPTEISEQYRKIDAPTEPSIAYSPETDEITLRWNYPAERREGIVFEVEYSVDEGPFELLETVQELGLIVQKPIPQAIYHFRITAYRQDDPENRSDSIEVVIEIPASLEDELDLIPDEDDEETEGENEENESGNGQGNGNTGGNGNSGNGNGNNNNDD